MIKIASFSDIHLGHRRNRTDLIIKALRLALPNNSETAELDIIFLVGDVFDRLLDLANEYLTDIDLWISDLIRICSENDIILRILEGTPSHDRKQSERFLTLAKIIREPIDIQYVKTLSIEYIERLKINVLYIPDEWDISTDRTLEQVKELMASKGLKQVDYALMHGQFEYQLASGAKHAPKHSSEEYHKLVKHLIFIGHVHNFSNQGRIYAQGSFDRLGHGEEQPKGHLRATVNNDGSYQVNFIENKLARRYVTINCVGLDLDESLVKIKKVVARQPVDSCIRIEAPSTNPILADLPALMKMYPDFVWTKILRDEETQEELDVVNEEYSYSPITINKDNIIGLLMSRLVNNQLNSDVITNAQKHLMELI